MIIEDSSDDDELEKKPKIIKYLLYSNRSKKKTFTKNVRINKEKF